MHTHISFGQIIKHYRSSLGITQAELARRVGCAPLTIRKIEANELPPTVQLAESLALALNIPEADQLDFMQRAFQKQNDTPIPSPKPDLSEIGLEDLSGRAVKGFQLGERIGSGGFGVVYRALQLAVQREVAVKIILPRYANQPNFIRRFEAEAHLVARLEHPHIVPLYDYWREPNAAYLVMRLLRSGSLHDLLNIGGLPIGQFARITKQIGLALHTAHRFGVIHRDIKPGNVLLDEDGNAYLADFGIAKDIEHMDKESLTAEGSLIGSPAYISPEQIRAEPVRPQSDIYCFGIMLFEMLTGRQPFTGPTPVAYIQQHLNENLPALSEFRHDLSADFDLIIQRATAKRIDKRYASVAELLVDLEHAITQSNADYVPTAITVSPAAASTQIETEILATLENPYRGLQPFTEADTDSFFGRDTLIQELLGMMSDHSDTERFLAVVGPSGSGKSSAVKAGLIPKLRRGGIPGSQNWFFATLTPGSHPWEEVESALLTIASNPSETLLDQLQDGSRGLLRTVRRILPADDQTELVLLIDQFEEIFSLVENEAMRAHFLTSLVTAVLDPRSRLRVVLTMRADFTDRPLNYVDFGELMRRRTAFVLPLTADELTQAIVHPIEQLGLYIEPQVVVAIMADVGQEPGMLPLLQYALTELFDQREGLTITLSAYQATGGVTRALARRADQLFENLDAETQTAARHLFLRLVTLGEGREDTRRRVTLSEFGYLDSQQAGKTPLTTILDTFGRHRLLTFDNDPVTRTPTIEVAHEALIREWPRFRDWLQTNRNDIVIHRRLTSAAETWLEYNKEQSYLYQGVRLLEAEQWFQNTTQQLNYLEEEFLVASLAYERKHRRQSLMRWVGGLSIFIIALVSVILIQSTANRQIQQSLLTVTIAQGEALNSEAIALASGATAVAEASNAENSLATAIAAQGEAVRIAAIARSRALAASSQQKTTTDPMGAWLLAIEALNNAQTDFAYAVLHDQVSVIPQLKHSFAHSSAVSSIMLSKDDSLVLTGSWDGTARIWEIDTGSLRNTFAHQDRIISTVWNQAETQVLTIGGNTVKAWDVNKGELLFTLPHEGLVFSATWNKDESTILTRSEDGTARVWGANRGALLHVLMHDDVVRSAVWNQNERLILTSSWDGTAAVWEANSGEMIQRITHEDRITSAAWNQNETRIITTSLDGTAAVWEAGSGMLLQVFDHQNGVDSAKWNQEESEILTVGFDRTAKVWRASDGELLFTLTHEAGIKSAVWNLSETAILTSSWDGTAKVWDAQTGALIYTLAHQDRINSAAWNQDSTRIVTTSNDGTAKMWDAGTGLLLQVFSHEDWVLSAIWNNEETAIFTHSLDGTVKVWDTESRGLVPTLSHADTVFSAIWNKDETLILTRSADGTAKLWSAASGRLLRTLSHGDWVWSAVWNQNETLILTSGADGTAKIWDADNGVVIHTLEHGSIVSSAAWDRAEKHVLTYGGDGTAKIWNARNGNQLFTLTHEEWIWSALWNQDESLILTSSDDGTAKIWNANNGALRQTFSHGATRVTTAIWNQDETQILTSGSDGTAKVWNINDGTLLYSLPHSGIINTVDWDTSSSLILTGSRDGTAKMWDAQNGKLLQTFLHEAGITSSQWNRDKTHILTTSEDGTARLWDALTGDLLQTLSHDDTVTMASWNGDETHILTSSADGTVKIWVADSGENLLALSGDGSPVNFGRWDKEGNQIMFTTVGGNILRFDLVADTVVQKACERAIRNLTWPEWQLYLPSELYNQTCPNLPIHESVPEDQRPDS